MNNPKPIEDGRVPQVIVRYTGERLGAVSYTGEASGQSYPFAAGEPDQYVHDGDVAKFRRFPEFVVLEHTRIDPAAAQLEERFRRYLESVGIRVEPASPATPSSVTPPRRPGRPKLDEGELQRMWHLKHHATRAWNNAQLALEFITGDCKDPVGTIEKRLERMAKRPELIVDETCPYCRQGYDPAPPRLDG